MESSFINKTHTGSWSKRLSLASAQNESGAALIIALVLLVVLAALVPVVVNVTSQDFKRTTSYTESRELFYLAEAGLEHGKSIVRNSDIDTILAGPDGDKTDTEDNGTVAGVSDPEEEEEEEGEEEENEPYEWNGNNYNHVAFGKGTYLFRVHDNDDGDGDFYTDSDNLLYIDGVGLYGDGEEEEEGNVEKTKTLRAMVRRVVPPPITLASAVTLTGPLSIISASGNGFTVQGSDSSGGDGFGIDGFSDSECEGKNALSTEAIGPLQTVGNNQESSCTEPACMAANSNVHGNFTGVDGGVPDITTGQTEFTGQDAENLRDLLVAGGPDFSYSGYTVYNGSDVGTVEDPVVMHFDAGAKINGNVHGTGILIVDGDLDIQGSLVWDGIIIIGACSTCACPTCPGSLTGTGSAQIHGAMVVGNSVNATAEFTGSADIMYSCEGVDIASKTLNDTFSVVSWNEID